MSSGKGTAGAIDGLVYDFCVLAVEGILQDRKGTTNPLVVDQTFADNSEYNRQSLLPWRRGVKRFLVVGLYIFNPKNAQYTLMERWKINYQKTNESKDVKPFPIINRRMLTLIRTVICYIRLLPGFNLLNQSKIKPTLGYQIYEPKREEDMAPFAYECFKYRFNPVSTSKGIINMGVTYVSQSVTKDILRTLNSTALKSSPKDAEKSAAIPIPVVPPVNTKEPNGFRPSSHEYNSYPSGGSGGRQHSGSYDRQSLHTHMQQQRIDEYEDGGCGEGDDAGSDNNVDSNLSSAVSAAPHPASNTQGGEEDLQFFQHQRRVQQQQPSDELRRRSFQLQNPRERTHSTSSTHANSGGLHQYSVSLDHYSSKPSLQQRLFSEASPSTSGGGGVMANYSPSISPSSATAAAAVAHNSRIRQASPAVPIAAPYGGGRGQQHQAAGSAASSHSTPPFSLGILENHKAGSYPDPTKASPPYAQFSTSLQSTSPAATHYASMLDTLRRRQSSNEKGGLGQLSNPRDNATAPVADFRLSVALPANPFLPSNRRTTVSFDSNTLDTVLLYEQRQLAWGGDEESDEVSRTRLGSACSTLGGDEADTDADSGRQFRISDADAEELESVKLAADGSLGDPVHDRLLEEGEGRSSDDEGEEDMFAFTLHPQEHDLASPRHLQPVVRRNSHKATGSVANGLTATQLLAVLDEQLAEFESLGAQLAAVARAPGTAVARGPRDSTTVV